MLCRNIRQLISYSNCKDTNQVTMFPDHVGHSKASNNLMKSAEKCRDLYLRMKSNDNKTKNKPTIPIRPKRKQHRTSAKRNTPTVYYKSRAKERSRSKRSKKK